MSNTCIAFKIDQQQQDWAQHRLANHAPFQMGFLTI